MRNGNVAVRVIIKEGRETIKVEHIGVGHNEEEVKELQIIAQERMRDEGQGELKLISEKVIKETRIIQKAAYSKYLYDTLVKVYERLKYNEIKDEVFMKLAVARIIEPSSKIDTIRILGGLGLRTPTEKGIRCSLSRAIKKDYRKVIRKKNCEFIGINKASLLLYDVTTLYFEIDKEDEYRKSGYSKERRLEPQIIVGLLVDKKGFPLALHSFEGNKAETKTIVPVLKEFKGENGIEEITVVADAGMLSAQNLDLLEEEGFKFIVGSRVAKTPYGIEEYARTAEISDGQIFEEQKEFYNKESQKKTQRRVVYQYKQKRWELDLRNIAKQIRKAEYQLNDNAQIRKSKFLKITGSKKAIDYEMIEAARKKAGIKGYVTNLESEGQEIINGYHNLFQVEKSFRMTKSDLQARPIYHQSRDSIEAHLTVCFAALAICRYIQDRTKISIKKFAQRLEPLRTAIIQIGANQYTAEPEIDIETKKMIQLLQF
jgi:transposase